MSAVQAVKVQDLEPENDALLLKFFAGQKNGHAYFGDHKYLLPKPFEDHVEGIRNMPLRKDDVWVATFPRSGTTWTQEMTWLICNDLDYNTARNESLFNRYCFIEFPSFLPKKDFNKPAVFRDTGEGMVIDYKGLEEVPSPRFIKTHLPMSLLHPQLLDTSRVVYVARDPRDVAVSFYHHNKLIKLMDFTGNFKEYWELFVKNKVQYMPILEHIKEAWALRNHPNMLFLFYEEMYHDLSIVVRRVAKFFEKEYTDQQIQTLCEHLRIDSMRENKAVNPKWLQDSPLINKGEESFFRKGKSGGWREYFDEEMSAQAEKWIHDNLKDTDIRFPEI